MGLLNLGPVFNVGPQELGTRSSLLRALGTGDSRGFGVFKSRAGRLAKRLDNFAVHGLDGRLLGGSDGRLRVDKVPKLFCFDCEQGVLEKNDEMLNLPISDWTFSRLTAGSTSPPEAISARLSVWILDRIIQTTYP